MAALGQLGFQERLGAVLLDALLPGLGVDHRADAGAAGVQRYAPEPAVPVGLDEDVVLVGLGQRFGPREVGVDRQVLEEGVPLFHLQMAGQQRRLSAGVDHETALRLSGDSVTVGEFHPYGLTAVEDDAGDLVALQHGDPLGLGVLQQDLVELGTPHLIGVRVPLAGLFEVPTPGCVAGAPDHGGAVLGQETRALHGGQRAQLFQYGNGGRQQRFSNVVPWELLPLQDGHLPTLADQHGGRGAAGGAASDHDNVGAQV